jgi:Ca2+-binding RTX toxin-like protein
MADVPQTLDFSYGDTNYTIRLYQQASLRYQLVPEDGSAVTIDQEVIDAAQNVLDQNAPDGMSLTLHQVSGANADDTITFWQDGGVFAKGGHDEVDAQATSGTGQIHTYAGAGDDTTILRFQVIPAGEDHAHGHHARGDDDGSRVRGNDIFDFRDLDNVRGVVVGRIEDFEATRDTIMIDGQSIDLAGGFSSGRIGGYDVRVVAYNGDHNDPSAQGDMQQWLLIETDEGGKIFYALEGARVDMDGNGGGSGRQESHFLKWNLPGTDGNPGWDDLTTVSFVDPVNYVPAGHTPDGGDIINDADSDAAAVHEIVNGTPSGDLIAAGLNDDTVQALGGNDKVWGGTGHDTIDAGAGNDTVWGGRGNDTLYGEAGNDILSGGSGADLLDGGEGWDRVDYRDATSGITLFLADSTQNAGAAAGDTLISIEGVIGSDHADVITGDGDRWDVIWGQGGADTLYGQGGNDKLWGEAGNDTLRGGDGDDQLWGGDGDDLVRGDDGNDVMRGGTGDDTLWGDGGNDTLNGDSGNDTVSGGAGNDEVSGGDGNDTVWGREGNDTLFGGNGDDRLYGEAGNDILSGGSGADLLDGGEGWDRVDYRDATSGITLFLADSTQNAGAAAGDTLISIEGVIGSDHADVITGDGDRWDVIWGQGGADTLYGQGGNDKLWGEAGNDTLRGGDGDDQLWGGDGDDLVRGDDGNDVMRGGTGDDTLWGDGGNDTLNGDSGNDTVSGGAGNDEVSGGDGNDTVWGREGNDTLFGGNGDDRLYGGDGNDILSGSAGADRFVFAAGDDADIIADFEDGIDTLDLSDFGFASAAEALARAIETGGDVVFDFGGGDVLTVENISRAALENDILV